MFSARLPLAAICLLLAACAEFTAEPTRRAQRAVPSPTDRTASGEALNPATSGLPLLTVEFPNKKEDSFRVHTIADDIRDNLPAATPATQPAPQKSGVRELPPITEGPLRITAQRNRDDGFTLTTNADQSVTLALTSPTGIGTVTLERTTDTWPATVHVKLAYTTDKPFTRLESFTASELLPEDKTLPLTTKATNDTATVAIPGFTRSPRIQLQWIDAYS